MVLFGLGSLPEAVVRITEACKMPTLAPTVANLSADRECGGEVFDGPVVLTEVVVSIAKAAEVTPFASAVTYLAADRERGGVMIDGPVVMSETPISPAEAALGSTQHTLVLNCLANAPQLQKHLQRTPSIPPAHQGVPLFEERFSAPCGVGLDSRAGHRVESGEQDRLGESGEGHPQPATPATQRLLLCFLQVLFLFSRTSAPLHAFGNLAHQVFTRWAYTMRCIRTT